MKNSLRQLDEQYYELNKYLVLMKYMLQGFSTPQNGACYILEMQDEICAKSEKVRLELDNLYERIYNS